MVVSLRSAKQPAEPTSRSLVSASATRHRRLAATDGSATEPSGESCPRRRRRAADRASASDQPARPAYEVYTAATGTDALTIAASHPPDLVILDLGLPDIDGLEVIQGLRGWSVAPIIVLSGRTDSTDKVQALDAGADDYLTKPFGVDELLARMRAVTRRSGAADAPPTVTFGDVTVDLAAKRVTTAGPRGLDRGQAHSHRMAPAGGAGPVPGQAAQPPAPAARGLGTGLRERSRQPAALHGPAPAQARGRPRLGLVTSSPSRGWATGSSPKDRPPPPRDRRLRRVVDDSPYRSPDRPSARWNDNRANGPYAVDLPSTKHLGSPHRRFRDGTLLFMGQVPDRLLRSRTRRARPPISTHCSRSRCLRRDRAPSRRRIRRPGRPPPRPVDIIANWGASVTADPWDGQRPSRSPPRAAPKRSPRTRRCGPGLIDDDLQPYDRTVLTVHRTGFGRQLPGHRRRPALGRPLPDPQVRRRFRRGDALTMGALIASSWPPASPASTTTASCTPWPTPTR